ncbi:VCBS repeat-containing protein [bacterium]|nr:VCBS repeat-containing protein [bacterium]
MIAPLFLSLAAVATAVAGPQEPGPDRAGDVEAFVEAQADWIGALKSWAEGRGQAPFSEAAKLTVPGGEPSVVDEGTVRLARSARDGGARRRTDAAGLRDALLGGQGVHDLASVSTKVLAAVAADGGYDLELRFEAEAPTEAPTEALAKAPLWQAVSTATVSLRPSPSPAAAGVEVEEWDCTALSVDSWEWASRTGELFVERTLGVMGPDKRAARLLGVGMDRWAQRLDDPSRSSWFGHQGIAAGDVNGDGRPDLLVAMPSGLPNMLLLQQPDGTVRDVAREVGLAWLDDTKGVLLADMDGDGRLDAVSSLGHVLVVQRQDERGRFQMAGWGVAPDEAPFYGISAADVDGDGDLDLFGARYVSTHYADTVPVPFEDARNGPSNVLFRNDGGRLVDATAAAGLDSGGGRFSLQGTFVDFDLDGDPDLYVVNDFGRNQLFVNRGGQFVDEAAAFGVEDQGAGMGASWSDFDRDGDLDLYVTNMFSSAGRRVAFQEGFAPERTEEERAEIRRLSLGNSLFVRDGARFVDRSDEAGVRMGRWAWGAVFADLNADGFDDLVSPAGFLTGPEPGDL